MPEIYVDADACPVKPEILKVAERHDLPVTFVANSGQRHIGRHHDIAFAAALGDPVVGGIEGT